LRLSWQSRPVHRDSHAGLPGRARPLGGRRRYRGRLRSRTGVGGDVEQGTGAVVGGAEGRAGVGMILVIDNYDSFTYNLLQYLGTLGADPVVVRNDAETAEQL